MWYPLYNKGELRKSFGMKTDEYLVGSFQKDTESASVWNGTIKPKLEKGPDLFVKSVEHLKNTKYPNLKVVLSGYYRQYVIRELKRLGIEYYYFERISSEKLNQLYGTLDLYIVASRVEAGHVR